MATKEDSISLSPTVTRIINEFSAALHSDETIDNTMVDRLDQLLATGRIPKPTEIKSVLFTTEQERES